MNAPVLTFTDRGVYCPRADVYIDPWKPVGRAIITHGHADHARPGMGHYLATKDAVPVLRHRLGEIDVQGADYGEVTEINGAKFSFHPAGHVPGSAQVRVELGGEVWVVSGDYKLEKDGISAPFEPVACHSFITECTFGMPVFRWKDPALVMGEINRWWAANKDEGRFTLMGAYSLGKAQRVLAGLDTSIAPILTHGAVEATNKVLRAQGIALPETVQVTPETNPKDYPGAFVLAPPAALGSTWAGRFRPQSTGFASGWMALRGDPAAAVGGSGVRDFGSRRLAGAEPRKCAKPVPSASSSPMDIPMSSGAGWKAKAMMPMSFPRNMARIPRGLRPGAETRRRARLPEQFSWPAFSG